MIDEELDQMRRQIQAESDPDVRLVLLRAMAKLVNTANIAPLVRLKLLKDNREEEGLMPKLTPQQRDRQMVLTPDKWPSWPTLPMKRRDGDIDHDDFCLFLMSKDHSVGEVTAYMETIWRVSEIAATIKRDDDRALSWGRILPKLRSKTFSNLDALLDEYTVD